MFHFSNPFFIVKINTESTLLKDCDYEHVHLASVGNSSCGSVQEMFLQPDATEVKNEPKMDEYKEVSHIMAEETLCEELPRPTSRYAHTQARKPRVQQRPRRV